MLPLHLSQIENDLENDSIFSYKSGNGRRASTTNNNNANPVDIVPGSPIAVRSKWVRNWYYIDEIIPNFYSIDSSETAEHERNRELQSERQATTMSGSAIAWELFLWFSYIFPKDIYFQLRRIAIKYLFN